MKYDPTWRSVIRMKVRSFEALVLSYLNKRENSNQRLTCMVNKLMQFRPKKARRELRCAHESYFRLAFSIVFSSRQCQTPKNKTPIAPWRMLKTRSNAPLTLTTTKSFIISVFSFRKVFLRRDHVHALCSMFIFGVRIGNLHTSLRTQLAASLDYSRRRLFRSLEAN